MNAIADFQALDVAQAMAQAVFPCQVAIGAAWAREEVRDLLAEEEESLPHATEKRRREFAAGRRAAHEAMGSLGLPALAVPAGPDRAPRWPTGVVGSISHVDGICLAAVAPRAAARALGLDIERDGDLPHEIVPEICTRGEMAWLSVQPAALRGRLATLIFSAKEAAYKCQYAISESLIGFDAMEVTPDLETGQFEATFTGRVPGFAQRSRLDGKFTFGAGMVITGVALAGTPRC